MAWPVMRAGLSPRAQYLRSHGVVGSLTTIENEVKLDPFATAAIETTAEALGVDASRARAFSLGFSSLATLASHCCVISGQAISRFGVAPENRVKRLISIQQPHSSSLPKVPNVRISRWFRQVRELFWLA